MKAGNSCIYYIKQFFNILLIISGILLLTIGGYIWSQTKQFSFVELTFIILGGLQILLGLFVMSSKRASIRIQCFNYILGFLFLAQLTTTILGFALKNQIIEKAAQAQESSQEAIAELEELLNQNVSIALYITISCLGIQLFALLFSIWYSNSLQQHNENYDLMFDEKSKKYISYDEYKNQQKETVQSKSDSKRNDIYSKNPEFYEWKQKQQQGNTKL